ncbi:21839_t:CDS:1, partial [Gigaspora rosea]
QLYDKNKSTTDMRNGKQQMKVLIMASTTTIYSSNGDFTAFLATIPK